MPFEVALPQTLQEVTWLIIGFMVGRAFKGIDQAIQKTHSYQHQNPLTKQVIKNTLNFFHHFWIGLLLVCYAPIPELTWLGWGLFIDDLPDMPKRFKGYFRYLGG